MTTVQIPTRRVMFASAVAMVLAVAPMIAVFAEPTVAPRAIAQGECTSGDTPDDYSLQCAPNMVPDFSDQLSEAEVAEPGFNGAPGGGGGGGMGGGGHGGGGGHR
jgi:hypothetical protein